MKAIETKWAGYLFRSRLEARWAVFFDVMGIRFEYEPQGFELDDGSWYLPDFRTVSNTGLESWYEVKPLGDERSSKIEALRKSMSEKAGLCGYETRITSFETLAGDPWAVLGVQPWKNICPRCGGVNGSISGREKIGEEQTPGEVAFICYACDLDTVCGPGEYREEGVRGVEVTPHKGAVLLSGASLIAHKENVEYACTRARSSRFERGEAPKPFG